MVKRMTLWILVFIVFFLALPNFSPIVEKMKAHFFQQKVLDDLKSIIAHLRILKESLESGLVPNREDWEGTAKLPTPWGPIFSTSLEALRSQGAPILPSLERMILSMDEEREMLLEARLKSSQAFGQVMISVILVPFFGLILYVMLPELSEHRGLYLSLVSVCMMFGLLAFYWMLAMMEDARFGGIHRQKRTWVLSSKLFFERMIAEIASGMPPDLAWSSAMRFLCEREPNLTQGWGVQIWDPFQKKGLKTVNPVEDSVVVFGMEIRRTIQQSLTEGIASMDRLESTYRNFLMDVRMKISRELQVLPNHCLKPLFILVLPSVMLLLFGAMAISFMRMLG
jgi:hypothetical protein